MASNRSDPERPYPRLHVEMRRLSDTALLVDGWLIENSKGMGRTVLRYSGSMEEARAQISQCISKYGAYCGEEDIVIR
jgi:predicted RNA-binding protein with PIN domain